MAKTGSRSDFEAAVRKAAVRLSEADVQRTVIAHLKTFRWRFVHFRAARTEKGWRTAYTGYDGFCDIIAVKDGRLLALELKSWRGAVTDEQVEWLTEFADVPGCYAKLVTPDNMDEVLMEIARP